MKKLILLILIVFSKCVFSAYSMSYEAPKLDISNLCSWLSSANYNLSKNSSIDWNNLVSANNAVAAEIKKLNEQLLKSDIDKSKFISDNAGCLMAFMNSIESSNKEIDFQFNGLKLQRANSKDFKSISIVDAVCCNILINFIQNKDIDIFKFVCDSMDKANKFGLKNMIITLINSINAKKICQLCGRDYCTANSGSANDKNIDYSLYLIIKAIDEIRIRQDQIFNAETDIFSAEGFFQTIDKLVRLARMRVGIGFELGNGDTDWIQNLIKRLFRYKIKYIKDFLPKLNARLTGYQEENRLSVSSNQKAIDEELYQAVIDNWQADAQFKSIMAPLVKKLVDDAGKQEYLSAVVGTTVKGMLVTPFLQYYFKNLKIEAEVIPDEYKPYIKRFFAKILEAGKFAAQSVQNGIFKEENFKNEIEGDIEEYGSELIKYFTRPNRKETDAQFSNFYALTRARNNEIINSIKEINKNVGKYVEERLTEYINQLFEIATKATSTSNFGIPDKTHVLPTKKTAPAVLPKASKGGTDIVSLATSMAVLKIE